MTWYEWVCLIALCQQRKLVFDRLGLITIVNVFVHDAESFPYRVRIMHKHVHCQLANDGSGADNFLDAGSCIDGRLTSAWNWGSKIEKKSYYPVFLLAGFTGFDGEFVK